jgi:hypothetical protein
VALPEVAKEKHLSPCRDRMCGLLKGRRRDTRVDANGTVPDGGTNGRTQGDVLTKRRPNSFGEALSEDPSRIGCWRDPEGIAARRPLPRRTPRQFCVSPTALFGSARTVPAWRMNMGGKLHGSPPISFLAQTSRARRRRPGTPIAASNSGARFSSAKVNPTLR